jgi:tetratricopeptide (TPR) repeat protein
LNPVIPNAEQLRAISQMTKGDLAEIPFPVLLHALAVHHRSVVLSIERRQVKKDVVLENGIPVDCQSNLLQDTLGKFMVGRGDINEEQNLQLLSKSATTGHSFTDLLVTEGLVSPHDLFKTLQQNLAKKLLDAFTWKSGSFHVSTQLPAVDSPLKVKAPQLVLTGISKFAPESEIAEALASFAEKKFFINPRPPFPLKELRLTKDHQEILGLVSLGKTMAELEAESGMDKSRVLRALYGLAVIGAALPEDWLHGERGAPAPAPELDTDFAAGAPEAGEEPQPPQAAVVPDLAEMRNLVMETYLRYRKLDAFDLLGAAEDASREQIEQAFIGYCEKFLPSRFQTGELRSMEEKARDLFIAGGMAFAELMNPETRNSLIARRNSKFRQLSSEEARSAFAIKSELLDSETQFQKGIALAKQGKYADALDLLQFAHDCEPQNGLYRAELAYCRYRKSPEFESKSAIDSLRETVRIDPDCGLAYYYAGMIYADGGEYAEAEPLLQRAIKLMAPDRRPIDALKKLKAAEREKPKKRLFF